MSQFTFKMPDLGEGTVDAEIVAWHTKPGDTVSEDQLIVEVMTDKAAVEVPAPVSGRRARGQSGRGLAADRVRIDRWRRGARISRGSTGSSIGERRAGTCPRGNFTGARCIGRRRAGSDGGARAISCTCTRFRARGASGPGDDLAGESPPRQRGGY